MHRPNLVTLLSVGQFMVVGDHECHLLAFLLIEDRNHYTLANVHDVPVDQIDVLLLQVQPFASIQGVRTVRLRVQDAVQGILEYFLIQYPFAAFEQRLYLDLFQLLDDSVLDNGHGSQQDGKGKFFLVELIVDFLFLVAQFLFGIFE